MSKGSRNCYYLIFGLFFIFALCGLVMESNGSTYAFRTSEELVEDADLVIIGTVKKINDPILVDTDSGKTVYTDAIFEVSKVYKGQTVSKEISVRMVGGIDDGYLPTDTSIRNAENYIVGKEYLLFLMKGWSWEDNRWTDDFYFTLTPQAKIRLTGPDSGIDDNGQASDVKELKKLLGENSDESGGIFVRINIIIKSFFKNLFQIF